MQMAEQSYNARFKLPGIKNIKLENRLRREKINWNSTDEVVVLLVAVAVVVNLMSIYMHA
jgi:hypothetical protein